MNEKGWYPGGLNTPLVVVEDPSLEGLNDGLEIMGVFGCSKERLHYSWSKSFFEAFKEREKSWFHPDTTPTIYGVYWDVCLFPENRCMAIISNTTPEAFTIWRAKNAKPS